MASPLGPVDSTSSNRFWMTRGDNTFPPPEIATLMARARSSGVASFTRYPAAPSAERTSHVCRVLVVRDHDDRDVGPIELDRPQELEAVTVGHPNVDECDVHRCC